LPRRALREARAGGAGIHKQLQRRSRPAHDASAAVVDSAARAMTEEERKKRGQKSAGKLLRALPSRAPRSFRRKKDPALSHLQGTLLNASYFFAVGCKFSLAAGRDALTKSKAIVLARV